MAINGNDSAIKAQQVVKTSGDPHQHELVSKQIPANLTHARGSSLRSHYGQAFINLAFRSRSGGSP